MKQSYPLTGIYKAIKYMHEVRLTNNEKINDVIVT
jgi:hypothetical protein